MYSRNQCAGRSWPRTWRVAPVEASSRARSAACRRSSDAPEPSPRHRLGRRDASRLPGHHLLARGGRARQKHIGVRRPGGARQPHRHGGAHGVADHGDAAGALGSRSQRVECTAGIGGLVGQARREVLAARLADAALVEAQRGDTARGQAGGKRVGDVEALSRHVRVTVERTAPAEQQRSRMRSGIVRHRQGPLEADVARPHLHDPLDHGAASSTASGRRHPLIIRSSGWRHVSSAGRQVDRGPLSFGVPEPAEVRGCHVERRRGRRRRTIATVAAPACPIGSVHPRGGVGRSASRQRDAVDAPGATPASTGRRDGAATG